MSVVICPKCHKEMGFESEVPSAVECHGCGFIYSTLLKDQSLFKSKHLDEMSSRKTRCFAEQQLRLLRSLGFIFVSCVLMFPGVLHSATGVDAPLYFLLGLVGFMLLLPSLLVFLWVFFSDF